MKSKANGDSSVIPCPYIYKHEQKKAVVIDVEEARRRQRNRG